MVMYSPACPKSLNCVTAELATDSEMSSDATAVTTYVYSYWSLVVATDSDVARFVGADNGAAKSIVDRIQVVAPRRRSSRGA